MFPFGGAYGQISDVEGFLFGNVINLCISTFGPLVLDF